MPRLARNVFSNIPHHIHLILTPKTEEGLQRVLKPLHYAQRINREKGWKGHLWQGRFFSAPLDDAYTWAAIRYVERNPVRAGMVKHAEEYSWSSAAVHCGMKATSVLKLTAGNMITESDWSSCLAVEENEEALQILRRNVKKGLPCGNDVFIEKLEKYSNKSLKYRPKGRPFADKG